MDALVIGQSALETVVNMQNGSVLLPLHLIDKKGQHGKQVTKSSETLFNLWHKQCVNVAV